MGDGTDAETTGDAENTGDAPGTRGPGDGQSRGKPAQIATRTTPAPEGSGPLRGGAGKPRPDKVEAGPEQGGAGPGWLVEPGASLTRDDEKRRAEEEARDEVGGLARAERNQPCAKDAGRVLGGVESCPRETRQLIRRAARERWPIKNDDKRAFVDQAKNVALNAPKVRDQMSALRVLATFEAQNQADEHLDEKHDRLDAGLVTVRVGFKVVSPDVIAGMEKAEEDA